MATNTQNPIVYNIEDAMEIIKTLGRTIQNGTVDKASAMHNLHQALKKLETARELFNRR